jgi:hypothetical protein
MTDGEIIDVLKTYSALIADLNSNDNNENCRDFFRKLNIDTESLGDKLIRSFPLPLCRWDKIGVFNGRIAKISVNKFYPNVILSTFKRENWIVPLLYDLMYIRVYKNECIKGTKGVIIEPTLFKLITNSFYRNLTLLIPPTADIMNARNSVVLNANKHLIELSIAVGGCIAIDSDFIITLMIGNEDKLARKYCEENNLDVEIDYGSRLEITSKKHYLITV